jgi:hypothetical protein
MTSFNFKRRFATCETTTEQGRGDFSRPHFAEVAGAHFANTTTSLSHPHRQEALNLMGQGQTLWRQPKDYGSGGLSGALPGHATSQNRMSLNTRSYDLLGNVLSDWPKSDWQSSTKQGLNNNTILTGNVVRKDSSGTESSTIMSTQSETTPGRLAELKVKVRAKFLS